MCIEMPHKKAGGRHPHLPPWEKRGIRMGGGVGTVERDCPFLFRRLLSLSIFSNKNVSIHVFFFKTKKIKKIKENGYINLKAGSLRMGWREL